MIVLSLAAHVCSQSKLSEVVPQPARLDAAVDDVGSCSSCHNCKCLSEITSHDKNFSSERLLVGHYLSQELLDTSKSVLRQHGDFIDDDERRLAQNFSFWRCHSHRRNGCVEQRNRKLESAVNGSSSFQQRCGDSSCCKWQHNLSSSADERHQCSVQEGLS